MPLDHHDGGIHRLLVSDVLTNGILAISDNQDSDGVGAEAVGAAGAVNGGGPDFLDLLEGPAEQGSRAVLGADILHLLEEAGAPFESLSLNNNCF